MRRLALLLALVLVTIPALALDSVEHVLRGKGITAGDTAGDLSRFDASDAVARARWSDWLSAVNPAPCPPAHEQDGTEVPGNCWFLTVSRRTSTAPIVEETYLRRIDTPTLAGYLAVLGEDGSETCGVAQCVRAKYKSWAAAGALVAPSLYVTVLRTRTLGAPSLPAGPGDALGRQLVRQGGGLAATSDTWAARALETRSLFVGLAGETCPNVCRFWLRLSRISTCRPVVGHNAVNDGEMYVQALARTGESFDAAAALLRPTYDHWRETIPVCPVDQNGFALLFEREEPIPGQ